MEGNILHLFMVDLVMEKQIDFQQNAGFKKSVEFDTTRLIRNRLGPHCIDTDVRYETRSGSV